MLFLKNIQIHFFKALMLILLVMGFTLSPFLTPTPYAQEKTQKTPPTETKESEKQDKNIDNLEEDLNQLKEEVFRSKARTSLLQEFLSKTYVEVFFRNKAQKDFELISALYVLDGSEIFKKEYETGSLASNKEDQLIFNGTTTPGRHEISVVLVYRGKKAGGYTDKDYEHQVHEDFSFVAGRGDVTSVTITGEDLGFISKDLDRTPSHYKLVLDFKIETQRLANIRKAMERRKFAVQLESGVLIDSYQIVSDRLNISGQHSLAIPLTVRGHWWFHPNWGVEGYYTYAFWNAGSGISSQDISMNMHWLGLDGKWRYRFGHSIYNPELTLKAGFNIMDTNASSNQQPTFTRLSSSYRYVDVGLEVEVPITWNFGFQGGFSWFPWLDLSESPLNSGFDAKKTGFEGSAGLYYNFWRDLSLLAVYRINFLEMEFTGRGLRTSSTGIQLNLVETQQIFQGALIGLKYEF